MENNKIASRVPERDLRIANYRPLRPGQDFKRSDQPKPTEAPLPSSPAASTALVKTVIPAPQAKIVSKSGTKPVTVQKPKVVTVKPFGKAKSKAKHHISVAQALAMFAVVGILGITGYVSYDTWHTNNQVKEKVAIAPSDTAVLGEGQDESDVPKNAVDSYTVAPNMPRALTIDSIGIHSRILPMTVTTKNAIQAPTNIFDSGWYSGSSRPGDAGAALIDGHASGATRKGLFAYLDKLKENDKITIELGDGKILSYKVVHTETVDLATIDVKSLLTPYGDVKEGINLITCTGTWVPGEATYDKRVVVFTERI